MRAFSEELDVFTKALSVGLVALTLCIVFINIKTPAALNDANAETKNFLLLEHVSVNRISPINSFEFATITILNYLHNSVLNKLNIRNVFLTKISQRLTNLQY